MRGGQPDSLGYIAGIKKEPAYMLVGEVDIKKKNNAKRAL